MLLSKGGPVNTNTDGVHLLQRQHERDSQIPIEPCQILAYTAGKVAGQPVNDTSIVWECLGQYSTRTIFMYFRAPIREIFPEVPS